MGDNAADAAVAHRFALYKGAKIVAGKPSGQRAILAQRAPAPRIGIGKRGDPREFLFIDQGLPREGAELAIGNLLLVRKMNDLHV